MIALFGTAVQAGVVMVIYLQEAVAHKAATRSLSRERLHEAILEGALLRLRPKVMTVATVVAGLLPIMWSQRTGAEVMKPLATPGCTCSSSPRRFRLVAGAELARESRAHREAEDHEALWSRETDQSWRQSALGAQCWQVLLFWHFWQGIQAWAPPFLFPHRLVHFLSWCLSTAQSSE